MTAACEIRQHPRSGAALLSISEEGLAGKEKRFARNLQEAQPRSVDSLLQLLDARVGDGQLR
jgi:hypothetical protein